MVGVLRDMEIAGIKVDGVELARIGEDGSDVADHSAAMEQVSAELQASGQGQVELRAVGHRVVHGGPNFSAPMVIDDAASASRRTTIYWRCGS